MKNFYLMLAVVGLVVPYYFFISFLVDYGMDFQQFFDFLSANPISIFFAADLVIATIVFYVYLYQEARRMEVSSWGIYVAASLLVGLSFALPLFLYVREKRLI